MTTNAAFPKSGYEFINIYIEEPWGNYTSLANPTLHIKHYCTDNATNHRTQPVNLQC